MKTKIFLLSVVLGTMGLLASNSYASDAEVFNENYKILTDATAVSGKNAAQSWNIVYGESKRPVTVTLKQTKAGDEYVVRNNYFEVKYVNSAKGFGVREVRGIDQRVPADLNFKVLNSLQLNNQRIISGTKIEDQNVVDMIASFLPELINDEFKNILN
ncbi:MAG: hypothetical protein ACK5JD_07890 [Mangrovibacterium sp.]